MCDYPPDCPPEWDYEKAINFDRNELNTIIDNVLLDLWNGNIDEIRNSKDSRPIHNRFFENFTPLNYDYFSGHYRGEDFHCLKYYPVCVPADPLVGYAPSEVLTSINNLAEVFHMALLKIENSSLPENFKLIRLVQVICSVFVDFLTIHPYANGNGHIARFIVWALLNKYGYYPLSWTVEPRPQTPEYSAMISCYRRGDKNPLFSHILRQIREQDTPAN